MALKVGDSAPDFTLKSKNETGEVKDYTLSDYKGKKNVVLFFYPQSFTGTCTDEMCTVTKDFDNYSKLGAETFGISVDSVFTQDAWSKANGITIPLLSDFNREATEKYGTTFPEGGFVHGMKGVSRRSVFVIDKEGKIRYIEILDKGSDLPDFNKVKEALKSLN